MKIGERVKEIRQANGLTMEKFGKRLGVGKTAISKIESGERSVTDQMVKSICREFHVREEWLRSGDEPMFLPEPSGILEELTEAYKLNDFEAAFLDSYLKLSKEDRDGFFRYVVKVFGDALSRLPKSDADILSPYEKKQETPEEYAERMKQEIILEERAAAKSEASNGTDGKSGMAG